MLAISLLGMAGCCSPDNPGKQPGDQPGNASSVESTGSKGTETVDLNLVL